MPKQVDEAPLEVRFFMAPELHRDGRQVEGTTGPDKLELKADLWSVGVLILRVEKAVIFESRTHFQVHRESLPAFAL